MNPLKRKADTECFGFLRTVFTIIQQKDKRLQPEAPLCIRATFTK